MAMRKPGVYAPLSANYADDEAIMEAGEDAELMYVRMLAYAARTPLTEGWISDRVIFSRLGILPRPAGNGAGNEPGTDAGSRAERLREVGLIERDKDGYRIVSWLKWNKSAEEMGRERTRDASRKKAVTSTDDGDGAGTDTGNDAGVPDPVFTADQNTDQKHVTEVRGDDVKGSRRKPERPLPADWAPSAKHFAQAETKGVDLQSEARAFRNHADTHDRRARDWDAAFRTWLDRAKPGTTKPRRASVGHHDYGNASPGHPGDQLSW